PELLEAGPPRTGASLAGIRRWGARRGTTRVRRAWVGAAAVGVCRQVALNVCAPKIALAAAASLAVATGVVGDRGAVPDVPVHRSPALAPHGQVGNLAIGPRDTLPPPSGSPVAPQPEPRTAPAAPPPAPPPPRAAPPTVTVAAMHIARRVVVGPIATLSARSIDFGWVAVGASVTRTVTLTNTGDRPLHVSQTTLFWATGVSAPQDDCAGHTLAPEQRCSVTLVYHPTKSGMLAPFPQLGFVDDAPGVGGGQVVELQGATT
ncbi:MAG: choice-of-anchor D domain-containing protein, partial [Candidatus Dormibacteria bacterium]